MAGLLDAPVLAAWLVTFAVHSTALLAAVWVFGRGLARLSDPIHDAVLKFALLAPLATATLQVALVPEPAGGHLAPGFQSPAPPPPGPAPELALQDLAALLVTAESAGAQPGAGTPAGVPTGSPAGPPGGVPTPAIDWSWLVVLAAGAAAAVGLLGGLRLRFGLWRILRRRRPVNSGPIASELRSLQRLAGLRRRVRLSTCANLQTPIAFGVLRPEICLPTRALRELEPEPRAGMLAHELAHISRGDPLWLAGVEVLSRLFYWQPLFPMAKARLRELAEYRSDAWGARLTGGLPLASCLVKVADWVVHPHRPVPLVPCMARQRSNLRGRIDRLLDGGGRTTLGLHGLWLPPAFAALLFAMTSGLPGATWSRSAETLLQPAEAARSASLPRTLPQPLAMQVPLLVLEEERDALQGELEALLTELPEDPDPELIDLLDQLDQRLSSFEQRRMQLMELILQWAGAETGKEPNPRR